MSNHSTTDAIAPYDLRRRLNSRKLRTGKITVYTDEVAGQAHLEVLAAIARVKANAHEAFIDPMTNLAIIEASPLDEERLKGLEAESARLLADLTHTALTLEWRAVPEMVVKDSERRARADFTVNGVLDPAKHRDVNVRSFAYLLAYAITKFTDHDSGETVTGMSFENAKALGDLLPRSEMMRLEGAYGDTQFRTAIGDASIAAAAA